MTKFNKALVKDNVPVYKAAHLIKRETVILEACSANVKLEQETFSLSLKMVKKKIKKLGIHVSLTEVICNYGKNAYQIHRKALKTLILCVK